MHIRRMFADKATGITMVKPYDLHHHVRVGPILKVVAPMLAKRFAGAIIMPNTKPPVTTAERVREYRDEVIAATGDEGFNALMTLYLTDQLDPATVEELAGEAWFAGVKYYPRGATTNSDDGIEDPSSLWTEGTRPYEVLQALARTKRVLLLHAADTLDASGNLLDPYEQEPHFIRETLPRIIDAHPELKISVEHLSTKVGAQFVEENGGELLGCSLTVHHLLLDRRALFEGGMFRPHRHWIPILQSEEDRNALRALVARKLPFVYLGSDSAPHPVGDKENACCKGGVMTVHAGIELYAEALNEIGVIEHLEKFASLNGPRFYGIEPSTQTIELALDPWKVRGFYGFEAAVDDPRDSTIHPFRAGETVKWRLVS